MRLGQPKTTHLAAQRAFQPQSRGVHDKRGGLLAVWAGRHGLRGRQAGNRTGLFPTSRHRAAALPCQVSQPGTSRAGRCCTLASSGEVTCTVTPPASLIVCSVPTSLMV